MSGCIVIHDAFGLGTLLGQDDQTAYIRFFETPEQAQQLVPGSFERKLVIGRICEYPGPNDEECECTILRLEEEGPGWEPHTYTVEFDDGLEGSLTEDKITNVKGATKHSGPLQALMTFQHGSHRIFKVREELNLEYNKLTKRGGGVRSLLSSRIDLHPHQAYVAGTVILDSKQRYLLADEVGLGKTIEAGIIIHDLIARKSRAKILILCPGALVQQWFSEMYSKFSGVIFTLPEASGLSQLTEEETPERVILSFHAALTYQDALSEQEWDMVVVDEVHHLIRSRPLYDLVQKLSHQDKGLLLLSALPAQHRDSEYYDLLALLDPRKYKTDDAVAREEFSELFDRQRDIDKRIGVINRRLDAVGKGDEEKGWVVIKQLETLFEIPVLSKDPFLLENLKQLDPKDGGFTEKVNQIVYHISDFYRINRRILRNSRERLIDENQIDRITRDVNPSTYKADQFELDAKNSLQEVLEALRDSGLEEQILLSLAKNLFHATINPFTLLHALEKSQHQLPPERTGEELAVLDDLVSYDQWDDLMEDCWCHAREHIEPKVIQQAITAATEWTTQVDNKESRTAKLFSILAGKHKKQPLAKFIVFAGFPGLAKIVTANLVDRFGTESVAKFYHGMHPDEAQERKLKEKEVRGFEIDRQKWLMVCDETGGEGRNFQFAAELFHYDLPLQPSKIEQRIGRLDRLGREKSMDVISNVLVAQDSLENDWYRCLSEGLGVFNQSISGLEFGLRKIEQDAARSLIDEDDQVLIDMPPKIKKRVNEERALNESQGQMDAVSCNRIRADIFLSAQSNPRQDAELESKFIEYFKVISDPKSFSFPYNTESVVKFYPEYARKVQLDLLEDGDEITGTFYRKTAQSRPDLEFFCIGNDFFDSMCRSLTRDVTGRTYAVECSADRDPWQGFQFAYRVQSRVQDGEQLKHQNFLDYFFCERIEHVFINQTGEIFDPTRELLALCRSFSEDNKDKTWWNLTKDRVAPLSDLFPNWNDLIMELETTTKTQVRKHFERVLSPKIEEEHAQLDEERRKLKLATPDGWETDIEAIDELKKALENWELKLDSAGFLSVNGNIRNA